MKQSGQKFKLCVRLIACIITIYGKIFCIFSRPSTYISDVAISDVAISDVAISEAVGGSLLQLWVVLCSTSFLDALLHAYLRGDVVTSPDAENVFKLAISS